MGHEAAWVPHPSPLQDRIWVPASQALEALPTGPRTPGRWSAQQPSTALGDRASLTVMLWVPGAVAVAEAPAPVPYSPEGW